MSKKDNVVTGLFAAGTGEETARKIALRYSQIAQDDDEVILVVRRALKDEGKVIGHAVGYEGNVDDFTIQLGMVELVKFAMIEAETDPGEG